MITALISRLIILCFGTLYPAYASYKAVKTKDVKEYVKWMMYWIVFAFFVSIETFTDVLLSFWFPFYYEIKVFIVLWLLSPATKGSSLLYRNFVHPLFLNYEKEIDETLIRAKERGYNTVLSLGTRGVSYATNVIIQTAMKGGGGLVEQILRKSYSLTDLSPPMRRMIDAPDSRSVLGAEETRRLIRSNRAVTGSVSSLAMTFPEVDVNIMPETASRDIISDIRSVEDISSGYSSTDQLNSEGVLTRSSSVSSARVTRRGTRMAATRRTPLPEDSDESDDFDTPTPSLPDLYCPRPSPNIHQPVNSLTVLEFKKSPSECSIHSHSSDVSNSSHCDEERRGKYKKRLAPKPPGWSATHQSEDSVSNQSLNLNDENSIPKSSSFETTIF